MKKYEYCTSQINGCENRLQVKKINEILKEKEINPKDLKDIEFYFKTDFDNCFFTAVYIPNGAITFEKFKMIYEIALTIENKCRRIYRNNSAFKIRNYSKRTKIKVNNIEDETNELDDSYYRLIRFESGEKNKFIVPILKEKEDKFYIEPYNKDLESEIKIIIYRDSLIDFKQLVRLMQGLEKERTKMIKSQDAWHKQLKEYAEINKTKARELYEQGYSIKEISKMIYLCEGQVRHYTKDLCRKKIEFRKSQREKTREEQKARAQKQRDNKEQDRKNIIKLRKQGMTYKEIGQSIDKSVSYVKRICDECDDLVEKKQELKDRDSSILKMREQGMTYQAIADELNMTIWNVARICSKDTQEKL